MADEIDKLLAKESSDFAKDAEIERVINAFRLDAYAVLDLVPGCTPQDIKAQYRKKSLLIHPDRILDPSRKDRANEAFDRLKKAETQLAEEKTRERLDDLIADARKLIIREKGWTVDSPELKEASFMPIWREKIKEVLIDDELRRRKARQIAMAEEGRQKAKEEAEINERKRKHDEKKAWEDNREERIGGWREFQKNAGKKKTKKPKVLG
ncbi:hypothetical protein SAICODRAFT_34584 [Saitoella complicata NRRL Y-17804]|uniref:J domain-containing protein n=1 Tax=Saitoella complicata (strain BCRC 22490 / CBS 7301 / JCM 7358 / NBRC 10748 / NRRL Y-17804) TaxID=698492 RepID=A0A0E9NMC1_SAICN|nr:uncharacterized protein SAICODRAFT_34584 [Saitoella complicata NRRL Y-17804]ODQ53978.1 hypothetical protein SAICODRAFT_34584 [Saitoella complicata NRRL Y-17804]GAO50984.1 hypothetical protein G7K_5097-t1 [Saitoella complicata NRRL Y-17804]